MQNVKLSLCRCHFGSARSHASLWDVDLNTNNGEVARKFKYTHSIILAHGAFQKQTVIWLNFVKSPIVYQLRV